MDQSVNAPVTAANTISAWVWYAGTDAVAQGTGLFYNTNYGTATAYDARRGNYVEKPLSGFLPLEFAGVAARAYSAQSSGQMIEIYVPGSKDVLILLNAGSGTTIDTGSARPEVTTGAWDSDATAHYGRGGAVPRQTASASTLCQADLLEGDLGAWAT